MDRNQTDRQLDLHSEQCPVTLAASERRLSVRAGGKTYSLDFRQAFCFGYTLLRTRKFEDAARVFESMGGLGGSDPLVPAMLAYCKTAMREYRESVALLSSAFPDEARPKAEQLHTAFVYLSVGMWSDAIEELARMARQWPDLPFVCLLLGDVLALRGKRKKAVLCWRLAVARDGKDGAVAAVARRLIAAQAKTHPQL